MQILLWDRANDVYSVQKIIISKTDGINRSPEKDLPTHNPKRKPLKSSKKVIVLGDWMLWRDSRRHNRHLTPVMKKKLNAIIKYTSSNDLTSNVNTMKYVRSITNILEKMNGGDNVQVETSGIIERRDHDLRGCSYENSFPVVFSLNREKYIIFSRSYTKYFPTWVRFILASC